MRKFILGLIIISIVCFETNVYAQNNNYFLTYSPESNKYPIILTEALLKAELLDLSEKERGYLVYFRRFYLKLINEKSKEYNNGNLRLTRTLNNKNSSLRQAKKIFRKNALLYQQLGLIYIESLEYLKKNLGRSNYEKLFFTDEIDLFTEKDKSLAGKKESDEKSYEDNFEQTGIEEEVYEEGR